LDKTEATRLFI